MPTGLAFDEGRKGRPARETLKFRLRQAVADGLAPEARVRVTQIIFGPPSPFPVAFRVMGPDPDTLRDIAAQALAVMRASPLMRTINSDWGERVPSLRFALDQDRVQSIGLTSSDIGQQLQFLLSGIPITDVREDIRSVQVTARSAGTARLDPAKTIDFTLVGTAGQRIPLSQIGTVDIRMEDPILRRRDRTPTMEPPSSMRYPAGSCAMIGCRSCHIAVDTSGGCSPSAMSPRT
jgi:multidrug efflux pump subunit AcrB